MTHISTYSEHEFDRLISSLFISEIICTQRVERSSRVLCQVIYVYSI